MTAPSARPALALWRPRAMRAAVVAWGVVAVLAFGASLPSAYRAVATECTGVPCAPQSLDPAAVERLAALGLEIEVWAFFATGFAALFALTCFVAAALLLRRASDVALATAAVLIALAVAFPQSLDALAAEAPAFAPVAAAVASVSLAAFAAWLLTFPDGRLRSRGSAAVLIAAVAYCALVPIAPLAGVDFAIVAIVGLVVLLALAIEVVLRLRGSTSRAQRAQSGIVLIAAAVAVAALAIAGILQGSVFPRGSLGDVVLQSVLYVVFLGLPVSIVLSVLLRGLWDERGSLLRALAAGVAGMLLLAAAAIAYVAAGAAGAPPALSAVLVAAMAAITAVPLFAVVRDGLRRAVRTPVEQTRAVRDLAERFALVSDPDAVPDAAARATVEAFGLRSAWIERDDRRSGPPDAVRLPLAHGDTSYGTLVVVPRPLQDLTDSAERRALDGIAAYIAAALAAASREQDLRAAHAQLVVARDDERRMLRDELHDELGPILGSVVLRLRAVEGRLGDDERDIVARVRRDVTDAVGAVRRIAYGLRPPVLEERGLAPALDVFGRAFTSAGFLVEVSDEIDGPIPSAVRLTAYRIAVEAIANAARHSGGTRCLVRLIGGAGRDLVVIVSDDGGGHAADAGVGMLSMRERARGLDGSVDVGTGPDGGLVVTATLPVTWGASAPADRHEARSGA